MSLSFFVDKNSKIEIDVYAWESKEGELVASVDAKDVPVDQTEAAKSVKFTFRRPGYKDSVEITGNSMSTNVKGDLQVDFVKLQDNAFRTLLTDWSLTDDEGKKVPLSTSKVDTIAPEIARSVATELLGKVNI